MSDYNLIFLIRCRGGSRGVHRKQVHPLYKINIGHWRSRYSNRAISDNCDKIQSALGSVAYLWNYNMGIICTKNTVTVSYTCFFFLVSNLYEQSAPSLSKLWIRHCCGVCICMYICWYNDETVYFYCINVLFPHTELNITYFFRGAHKWKLFQPQSCEAL